MTINAIGSNKPIEVAFGGTGQSSLAANGVLVGAATSGVTSLAVGGANSILVGSAGADPAFSTTANIYANSISFDAGSNTLSTYVVSSFTPTLEGSGTAGTPTYTVQNGYYTRIGNKVWIQAKVGISAITGATTSLKLGNLPYTVRNINFDYWFNSIVFDSTTYTWPAGYTDIKVYPILGATYCLLYPIGSTKTVSPLAIANQPVVITYSISYQI